MRTGRSLTVCWRLLPGEGGSGPPGGRLVWGGLVREVGGWGSGPGGCLVWGGLVPGGLVPGLGGWYPSMHWGRTPPVDRQTPVKTLPWPNFVAAGNKTRTLMNKFDASIALIVRKEWSISCPEHSKCCDIWLDSEVRIILNFPDRSVQLKRKFTRLNNRWSKVLIKTRKYLIPSLVACLHISFVLSIYLLHSTLQEFQ